MFSNGFWLPGGGTLGHRVCVGAVIVSSAALLVGCTGSPHPLTPAGVLRPEATVNTGAEVASATADVARAEGLAFVSGGQVWQVKGGVARKRTDGAKAVRSLAYSADRSRLLFVSDEGSAADIMSLASGSSSPKLLYSVGQSSLVGSVRLEPNTGDILYTYYGDPYTLIRRVGAKGVELAKLRTQDHTNGDFDIASDGRLVYASFEQDPARVLVCSRGNETVLPLTLSMAIQPAFSASGKQVVLAGRSSQTGSTSVWIVELASGRSTQLRSTVGLEPQSPAVSSDGSTVAFRSAKNGSMWLVSVGTGTVERLPLNADEGGLAW